MLNVSVISICLSELCETAGILDLAGSPAMKEVDDVVKPTPEGWLQNRCRGLDSAKDFRAHC